MYHMKENESVQLYLRRIKKFKEYQKTNSLARYHCNRSKRDEGIQIHDS